MAGKYKLKKDTDYLKQDAGILRVERTSKNNVEVLYSVL
jgi:hypothetical protein